MALPLITVAPAATKPQKRNKLLAIAIKVLEVGFGEELLTRSASPIFSL
jgi:hypothetical protein